MTKDLLPQLQSYIPIAYPARLDPQVSGIARLSGGWESDVYAFTIEWGSPGSRQREDLVLRIYPGPDAYAKSANEFRNLTFLRSAGYPVPRVDCLERDHSPFGGPFIIMERIHGRVMWDELFHYGHAVQQKRMRQFCRLFARLHAIDWRHFHAYLDESQPIEPKSIIERQFTRWQPFIDALPMPGFKAGWEWLMARQHRVTSAGVSLVHWDFHPANILIKENRENEPGGAIEDHEAVVIDWTGLELTDFRFDLSWTLLLITTYEGVRWRAPFLREYERQAGQEVKGLEFFDAVACYRRLVSIVGSLTYGAEKLGMRPGAETIMRGQAAHLRKVYAQYQALTGLKVAEVEEFLAANAGFLSRVKRLLKIR